MQRIWNLFLSPAIQAVIASAITPFLLLSQSALAQSTPPQSSSQLKATLKFALKGHTGPIGYTLFSPDGRSSNAPDKMTILIRELSDT